MNLSWTLTDFSKSWKRHSNNYGSYFTVYCYITPAKHVNLLTKGNNENYSIIKFTVTEESVTRITKRITDITHDKIMYGNTVFSYPADVDT